jgi:upstream activation factor subunit UAF30|tara:strand:- start:612 stop:1217 length:606 start_codon:yes stop_codon:yes gene_type:complete
MPKVKKATKAKKTSSKSKKAVAKEAPVVEVVAAPVTEVAAVPATETPAVPTLTESFGELLGQLQALRSQLTSVTGQVRALQKRADRELKNAHKASKKRQKRTGNRAPSGFVKPTKISLELANFLGKPKGTEMARTEVTREINKYIRANKLQDKDNGRIILADTKLRKLLKLKKDDELTYFNLQRYMSPHFAKNVKKVVASE